MGERCLTRPTLAEIGQTRPWTGKMSVTQHCIGTMECYLKITVDYYIDPRSRGFMLHGTRHHRALEVAGKKLDLLAEEYFSDDDCTGIPDVIQPDEQKDGFYILCDYKTWGSYKVAKCLGLKQVDEEIPGEYYRSGARKGQQKTRKVVVHDPAAVDFGEAKYQLNRYRLFAEDAGLPISKMKLQITVRDGGTYIALNRGVTESMYYLDVPRMDDKEVRDYFDRKRNQLMAALAGKEPPVLCTEEERWEDRKCLKYCDVAFCCPYAQDLKADEATRED